MPSSLLLTPCLGRERRLPRFNELPETGNAVFPPSNALF
jgi:hypothetical protein